MQSSGSTSRSCTLIGTCFQEACDMCVHARVYACLSAYLFFRMEKNAHRHARIRRDRYAAFVHISSFLPDLHPSIHEPKTCLLIRHSRVHLDSCSRTDDGTRRHALFLLFLGLWRPLLHDLFLRLRVHSRGVLKTSLESECRQTGQITLSSEG